MRRKGDERKKTKGGKKDEGEEIGEEEGTIGRNEGIKKNERNLMLERGRGREIKGKC